MLERFAWCAVALTAVAVVAGGCSGNLSSNDTPSSSAATAAPDLSAMLTPGIEDLMKQQRIPGAVVLVRTPDANWQQAFGTREIGKDDPVTVDDHFRVGSNTKTMVGTVMLQLVQEGQIGLDDPVATYWPNVPNGNNISIRQILDMRSGLYNYTESLAFNEILDRDPRKAWRPEELLQRGLSEPVYFPPGQGFHYSNTNTVLAGLIIEKLTGQDLATVLRERIFNPLGLEQTSFPAIDDASIPAPSPRGYMYGTNVSTMTGSKLPPDQIASAEAGQLQPNDFTDLNPSWGWSAGAAVSTVENLATYIEALVGSDTLLNPDFQEQRLASIQSDPDQPDVAAYGLALAKFGPMVGHDGSLPGYQSFMGYDPETKTTLIVLCNLTDGPEGPGGAANELAKGIIPKLIGS